MRFTALWHRKAAPERARAAAELASALAAISDRLDGLSRKVDRLDHVRRAPADQSNEALETAIAGLRGIVAHVASADALATLGGDVRTLAQRVGSPEATGSAVPANLEQRIGSIADAIAALRAENRRRATQNLAAMIELLTDKTETLEQAQTNPAKPAAALTRRSGNAEMPFGNLDSIERGIAELIRNVQEVRAHALRSAALRTTEGTAPTSGQSRPAAQETDSSHAPVRGMMDDLLRRIATLERNRAETAQSAAELSFASGSGHNDVSLTSDSPPLAPLRQSDDDASTAAAVPRVSAEETVRSASRGKLVAKILGGLGLAAALAGALAFLVSHLTPRVSFESMNPQPKIADRGPRLDSPSMRPGSQSETFSAGDLAANLPLAIGTRLIAAAAAGDPRAAYEVSVRLSDMSGSGTNQQAVAWLERAAAAGLAPAQLTLGGLYEKGVGVAKDPQRARIWYLAAARRGNAKAMHNLAVLWAQGAGGKVDYTIAADWFRRAAVHGIADSQFNLAGLYERGTGVELNPGEAYKWYGLAARQGDPNAIRKRDEVAQQLDERRLQIMNATIEYFVAEPQPEDAIAVKAPPGGWEQGPAEPQPKASQGPRFAAA
jgi:localization factor PodJL